jgi:RimJ/RimL family protein N-acetyltransferase
MSRWTPLASPFDRAAAQQYVDAAHRARRELGALQLAVTEDATTPLGEVLVFPSDTCEAVELAYAVGAPFQGRGIATRAVRAGVALAATAGASVARLVIATDNVRSQRVARAAGFQPTPAPLSERRRKGFVLTMVTWERHL